jgi:hypothetical protein
MSNSPTAIGPKLDALANLRDQKKLLNDQLKDVNAEYDALQKEIMDYLDQQGVRMTGGARYRASIIESVVPDIVDWEPINEYIIKNKSPYMFERRLSVTAWRELYESGELVPGTQPFTKRTLSLTKV